MTLWTDLFASTKIGDIQFLAPGDNDPNSHLALTATPQALNAADFPGLAERYGTVPAMWDTQPLTSFGAGYYPGGYGSNMLPIMEETPGGKMRLFHPAGYFESTNRGQSWTNNTTAPDPVKIAGFPSATGVNGNPGGVIRRQSDGRLFSFFDASDVTGSGFNKKQVCYSDDFGASWNPLFWEDGDGGSNTYMDLAWSPRLGQLVAMQYNGRLVKNDGQSSTFTQVKAGNGGSAPFNYSIRWVQQINNGDGAFVVCSYDRIYMSTDATTWNAVMMPANTHVFSITDYGPVGLVGYRREMTSVQTGGTVRPARSLDGITWTAIDLNIPYEGVVGGTITLLGIWSLGDRYMIAYKHSLAPAGQQVRFAYTTDFVTYSSTTSISQDSHLLSFGAFFSDATILTGPHAPNQNSYGYNYANYQYYRFDTNRVVVPGINSGYTGTLKPYLRKA